MTLQFEIDATIVGARRPLDELHDPLPTIDVRGLST